MPTARHKRAEPHLVIIGGGLAGLAAGCYAQRSGYRTTIVEHNLTLGGVCTAWRRGPYTVDGCIHWLTGGPFQRIYEELGILPAVQLRTLETWATYKDTADGFEVSFTKDLDALVKQLTAVSKEDAEELSRLRTGAVEFLKLKPPVDAPELMGPGNALRMAWEMRSAVGSLVHFRKPVEVWAREHLKSPRLRRIFTSMVPKTAPTLFLLMVLGYLEKGYLSRPVGGTTAFRDALERSYRSLGGKVMLHSTVDEVLVDRERACGVRLEDGTIVKSDAVISTSSSPETVLRLLGGRYDAAATRDRLAHWKLFDPIVLVSFGVAKAFEDSPSLLILDGITPFEIGGRPNEHLYVRVCNDDASFAPPGHCVIQAMQATDYQWWATRGSAYHAEKEEVAEAILARLEPEFPGIRSCVRMVDVVTPLTYWSLARSWRGAYEGWMPSPNSFFGHVKKKLTGLGDFYMAGQWVEPGGGVPTAVMSGRHVVQLLCADNQRPFVPEARSVA